MKEKDLKNLSNLFKALADEKRLKMLSMLCNCKSANVGELASCCDVDFSGVSRHLSKLKAAGVLRAQKEGKEVVYDLEGKTLARQLRALADYIENSNCC